MKKGAEIIAVGSELLLGQIVNSNAQFLSQQLARIGIDVYFHSVVGDNPARLKETLNSAHNRSKIVILTGGLGPTKDDLTKHTVARHVGTTLTTDEEALAAIVNYFQQTGRVMTDNNRQQALVLAGATVFLNQWGMAPGMAYVFEGTTYVLLPGPPKEMKPMYTTCVEPYFVHNEEAATIHSRVLRFFGIGEAALEVIIQDLLDEQTNPTIAPLAKDGEVTLRLTAKTTTEAEANHLLQATEEAVQKRLSTYFYGYGDKGLHERAIEWLQAKGWTCGSAESFTGGLFAEQLTAIPGSSQVFKGSVVAYSNEIKQSLLGVSSATLHEAGAVSSECAKEMAEGARDKLNCDVAFSFTGVAGPSEQENKRVGTVFVAISQREKPTKVFPLQLAGSRRNIRHRAVQHALFALLKDIPQ